MHDTPLRSVLFMPASNRRAMDKARDLPADAVIFDLEDAVAPAAKAEARAQACAQLAAGGYGDRPVVVRCNGLDTPWGAADLEALAAAPVSQLCLPKVETVDAVDAVLARLAACGREDLPLWTMLETPRGIANAASIAAHPAVAVLVLGTTDLATALRVPGGRAREGLAFALSQAVLAARCAGIPVLDGVSLVLDDETLLAEECEHGRALGFDGKTLIHPAQVATANRVFGPAPAALEHARRLLAAWESAEAEGKGLAVLDGKLIETMHVDEARRLLRLGERLGAGAGAAAGG
ncbi:MAG TPA: CoA ester lyase [Halieaceae bacterium]|nr:CoA ester lyase [Halieaceae bacterium]